MKMKFIYVVQLLVIVLMVTAVVPAFTSAQVPTPSEPDCTGDPCADVDTAAECIRNNAICAGGAGGAGLTNTDRPLAVIIGNIVKGLLGFLGIVFMILILYGGFVWMTAAGNEDRVRTAKKILANSTIGLFIVIISYALSLWIFDVIISATNTDQIN